MAKLHLSWNHDKSNVISFCWLVKQMKKRTRKPPNLKLKTTLQILCVTGFAYVSRLLGL